MKKKNTIGQPGSLDGPPIEVEKTLAYKAGLFIGGTMAGGLAIVGFVVSIVAITWIARGIGWLWGQTF